MTYASLMRVLATLYCIILLGSTYHFTNPTYFLDSHFQPFLQAFCNDAIAYNAKVDCSKAIITFADLPPDYLGYCAINIGDGVVLVQRDEWTKATYITQVQLIYHELGHCLLRRKHFDTLLANGQPASIMHSKKWADNFIQNKAYYLQELFSKHGEL